HTAHYDAVISRYLTATEQDELPQTLTLSLHRHSALRYGENPHQRAALYTLNEKTSTFTEATQHQGKPLSYNNLADADAAVSCVQNFAEPACVIVKHANPCGVAQSKNLLMAYEKAYATDPTSAFGGIIAFNRPLDAQTTQQLLQQFVEVVIAPAIEP